MSMAGKLMSMVEQLSPMRRFYKVSPAAAFAPVGLVGTSLASLQLDA